MLPCRSDQACPALGHWKPAQLETANGFQQAQLFERPESDKGFPDVYLLQEQHQLRPEGFTATNYHRCGRHRFDDYVMAIRKDLNFMRLWDAAGKRTNTPSSDVFSNLENGMPPLRWSYLGHV